RGSSAGKWQVLPLRKSLESHMLRRIMAGWPLSEAADHQPKRILRYPKCLLGRMLRIVIRCKCGLPSSHLACQNRVVVRSNWREFSKGVSTRELGFSFEIRPF